MNEQETMQHNAALQFGRSQELQSGRLAIRVVSLMDAKETLEAKLAGLNRELINTKKYLETKQKVAEANEKLRAQVKERSDLIRNIQVVVASGSPDTVANIQGLLDAFDGEEENEEKPQAPAAE